MIYSQSAGGIVLNNKNEVAIVKQRGGSWSLPKGHIEKDEAILDAAQREIYEETGIKNLEYIKKLGSYKRHGSSYKSDEWVKSYKTIYMFLFKTNETTLKPLDSQNPEALWVPINKVADKLTHAKDKQFFLDNIKYLL